MLACHRVVSESRGAPRDVLGSRELRQHSVCMGDRLHDQLGPVYERPAETRAGPEGEMGERLLLTTLHSPLWRLQMVRRPQLKEGLHRVQEAENEHQDRH